MVTNRPTNGVPVPPVPQCVAIATLASVPRGAGGSPTAVCPVARVEPAVAAAEQAGAPGSAARWPATPRSSCSRPPPPRCRPGSWTRGVVLMLADLASPRRLAIADFPVAAYEPPYALRRRVLLTAVDGMPASGDPQPLCARGWEPATPVRPELGRDAGPGPAHRLPRTHPDRPARRAETLPGGSHDPDATLRRVRAVAVALLLALAGLGAAPAVALATTPAAGPRRTYGSRISRPTRPRSTSTSPAWPIPRNSIVVPGVGYGAVSPYRPVAPGRTS